MGGNFVIAVHLAGRFMNRSCDFFCRPRMAGARFACSILGAKHRAPTIETVVQAIFNGVIKNESTRVP